MTDAQLYLAVGGPTLAALIGLLVNGALFLAINARLSSVDSRMNAIENRMTAFESKFDARFDMLLSKVVDIDNRLTRLEAQQERR